MQTIKATDVANFRKPLQKHHELRTIISVLLKTAASSSSWRLSWATAFRWDGGLFNGSHTQQGPDTLAASRSRLMIRGTTWNPHSRQWQARPRVSLSRLQQARRRQNRIDLAPALRSIGRVRYLDVAQPFRCPGSGTF